MNPPVVQIQIDSCLEPFIRKYLELEDDIFLVALEKNENHLLLKCALKATVDNAMLALYDLDTCNEILERRINSVILGMTFMYHRLRPPPSFDARFSFLAEI